MGNLPPVQQVMYKWTYMGVSPCNKPTIFDAVKVLAASEGSFNTTETLKHSKVQL